MNGKYKYIHIATHGILDNEVPGVYEPALVLGATNKDDGYLRASEIEKLKLDTDLAILSACNTGSGEIVSGEGVIGLSRSFLIAGSKSVAVSLWQIPSKETVILMKKFYHYLSKGKSKRESLRLAQIYMSKTPASYSNKVRGLKYVSGRKNKKTNVFKVHPFYWSAFVLVGN